MEYNTIRKIKKNESHILIPILSECNLPTSDLGADNQTFYGLFDGEKLMGCIGFEQYGSDGLLRSFAVYEEFRGKGFGKLLYNKINDHCLHAGITTLYLLTTTAAGFFEKQGWAKYNRSVVPSDLAQSQEFANICPSSAVCMQLIVFKNSQHYAVQIFDAGFNCAQSVFVPNAVKLGIPAEKAFQLATGFGAGMVYRGETCGAVTGAMMSIGLLYGRSNATDTQARDKTYALINQFYAKFKEKHGSLQCKELLQLDISVPGNREKASQSGLFDTLCPKLVEDASAFVDELIDK